MATVNVITGGPQTVWSNGGSAPYPAAIAPVQSTDAAEARITQEMANKTTGLTAEPGSYHAMFSDCGALRTTETAWTPGGL